MEEYKIPSENKNRKRTYFFVYCAKARRDPMKNPGDIREKQFFKKIKTKYEINTLRTTR